MKRAMRFWDACGESYGDGSADVLQCSKTNHTGEYYIRMSSIISSKGQIVIPATLRKRYGLNEGTAVVFQEEGGRLVLEPSNHAAIYALQGSLAGFPLEEDLAQEKQAEQKRENER
jgi:AbrB family looped-hinge helix DNA binding protein